MQLSDADKLPLSQLKLPHSAPETRPSFRESSDKPPLIWRNYALLAPNSSGARWSQDLQVAALLWASFQMQPYRPQSSAIEPSAYVRSGAFPDKLPASSSDLGAKIVVRHRLGLPSGQCNEFPVYLATDEHRRRRLGGACCFHYRGSSLAGQPPKRSIRSRTGRREMPLLRQTAGCLTFKRRFPHRLP